MKEAIEYVEHGFGLVRLQRGQKKPITEGWQLPGASIRTPEKAATLRNCGIGMHHVDSRTCALDIDHFSKASDWLSDHGIDLASLLMMDETVQSSSGRPGRAKIFFKIPDGEPLLLTQIISDEEGNTILEFRCAYHGGSSAQDVLPPSVNPISKIPYQWKGDWRKLSDVPANLLDLWLSFGRTEEVECKPESPLIIVPDQTLVDLRNALKVIPSIDRVEWVRLGLALKPLGEPGMKLWMEWSEKSSIHRPAEDLQTWRTLRTRVIDYRSIFVRAMKIGWRATPKIKDSLTKSPLNSNKNFHSEKDEIPGADLICAADVTPKPIDWIWNGWLARGKIHLIAGRPNAGKTTIALAFASTISCGGRWPDGTRAQGGSVVMWSGEDDIDDTLRPRLEAMGANLRNVYFVNGVPEGEKKRPFNPAYDMDNLAVAVRNLGNVSMIIVDPIVSAIAGDGHKANEVRISLQPLVDLGRDNGCAVLGVCHFTKGTRGTDLVDRVSGSGAMAALARVLMAATKHKDGNTDEHLSRLLVRAKSNIGPDGGGFDYDIRESPLESDSTIRTTGVHWGKGLIDGEARHLFDAAETEDTPTDVGPIGEAMVFLRYYLKDGVQPARNILDEAKRRGISKNTLYRAKDKVGINTEKDPSFSGGWNWRLLAGNDDKIH